MDERRAAYIKAIAEVLPQIHEAYSHDSMIRSKELGELAFRELKEDAASIKELASQVEALELNPLPTVGLLQILDGLNGLHSAATNLRQLSLGTPPDGLSHKAFKGRLLQQFDKAATESFEKLTRWIPVASSLQPGRAGALLDDISKQAEEAIDRINHFARSAEQSAAGAAKAAERAGLSSESEHFGNQADEHRRAGRVWLVCVVLLTFAAASIAWRTMSWLSTAGDRADSTASVVAYSVGKAALLTIAFTALLFAMRTFRSHQHNYVINKHRANAIKSFQAFASSPAADDATRAAVLLQAANCIYSHQSSGYTGRPEAESPQISGIAELVRAMVSDRK